MLAVQYDDDMLKSIDGSLDACAYMLRQARRIMDEGQPLDKTQVECLIGIRDQMGVWLSRYDRGYWVPNSKLCQMREFEAKASGFVGHERAPPGEEDAA